MKIKVPLHKDKNLSCEKTYPENKLLRKHLKACIQKIKMLDGNVKTQALCTPEFGNDV